MIAVILSGCATRTVGMQAPLAHDYDGMQWRRLDGTVTQRIIVAPGYTAVIENDPGTDPAVLGERIRALPDDVRSAELVEIRVALRPAQDRAFEPSLEVSVAVVDADEPAVVATVDDLGFEDDWAVFPGVPSAHAGETVEIVLRAAVGWEYGITAGRVPYGGYNATVAATDGEQQDLGGSLGFETVFEQSTDRSRMLEESVGPALRSAVTDPFLAIVYAIILGTGSAVWLVRSRGGLIRGR